jgi:hypothetical protein
MASFVRATGHAANPIVHNKQIFRDTVLGSVIGELMGSAGSGAPIVTDFELAAQAGDTKTIHLTPWIDVDPIEGQDVTLKGNESSITEAVFDVVIDERNWPIATRGRMTDQRSLVNWQTEAKKQIGNLIEQYNNDQIFRQLSGYTGPGDTSATTPRVNGANRCFSCTGTSGVSLVTAANSTETLLDSSMAQTDLMNMKAIDDIVAHVSAKRANDYRLNCVKRTGQGDQEFYHLFLSPIAANQLRADPDWQNLHLSRLEAGLGDSFATGFLGVYNNVLVRYNNRIKTFNVTGTDTYARNVLIGSDALYAAWAVTLGFDSDTDDYGREQGQNGYQIRGEGKIRMSIDPDTNPSAGTDDQDLGVAQIISATPALA